MLRKLWISAIPAVALALPGPTFIPDAKFQGSSLSGSTNRGTFIFWGNQRRK